MRECPIRPAAINMQAWRSAAARRAIPARTLNRFLPY